MPDRSPPGPSRVTETVRFEPAFRLDLGQQRKRAKELLRASHSGDETARRRFRQHHPEPDGVITSGHARLADAQLVIARELGLPSWPKLKTHIAAMRSMRDRIAKNDTAPDSDMTTLHIRCGSDIKATLFGAGFIGDFLEYSDPLCQGPIVDDASWLDLRAAFLSQAYGDATGRTGDRIAGDLARAETALREAATRYERVVLWFEHDSYDQLILARCLAQFAETPPNRLEMVTLEHYPGAMRFIGLGQLPPEAMRLLWNERVTLTGRQTLVGQSVWSLLRASDPVPLATAISAGFPELPYLGRALRRHCQELPWTKNGLSLTERLILELLAEHPRTIGEIFRDLHRDKEPLPWLGDIMLRFQIGQMKRAIRPVFTAAFDTDDQRWFKERLTPTRLGLAVLAGRQDWLGLSPPDRWWGGVCIRPNEPGWRWNDDDGTIVRG